MGEEQTANTFRELLNTAQQIVTAQLKSTRWLTKGDDDTQEIWLVHLNGSQPEITCCDRMSIDHFQYWLAGFIAGREACIASIHDHMGTL